MRRHPLKVPLESSVLDSPAGSLPGCRLWAGCVADSRTEDLEVIRRVRDGDRNAYALLVNKYETRVRGCCRSLLRNAADAEDAAQEVFIRAYEGLTRFRGDAAFSTWLYRIAVNRCRDLLRKSSREKAESWERLLEEHGERAEAMLATEPEAPPVDAALLERILGRLPEPYRAVLVLREMHQLSYEEIAAALGCSLDAVKGRLKRARQELERIARPFFGREASK